MAPLGINVALFTFWTSPSCKKCYFYALWPHLKVRAKKPYLYFCQEIVFLSSANFFPVTNCAEKDSFCVNKYKIYFFTVKKSSRTKFNKIMSINSS